MIGQEEITIQAAPDRLRHFLEFGIHTGKAESSLVTGKPGGLGWSFFDSVVCREVKMKLGTKTKQA